ncbi:mCG147632, isoform CRA_a [Mus musculus]|nr:mCG147632, isoform CRA_a [Mus musculus]
MFCLLALVLPPPTPRYPGVSCFVKQQIFKHQHHIQRGQRVPRQNKPGPRRTQSSYLTLLGVCSGHQMGY